MKTICFSLIIWGMVSAGLSQVYAPYPTPVPAVRIISPPNRAVFHAPVDIPIFAYAGRNAFYNWALGPSSFGYFDVTNVEFYAVNNGVTNDLGHGINLGSSAVYPTSFFGSVAWSPIARLGDVWMLVWSNAVPGSNTLLAVAKYSPGLAAYTATNLFRTSPPVNITILLAPPNTNGPDVVSIVATDPIAIAGTNAYVWPGITNGLPTWTNWPPPHWGYVTNWGPKSALFTLRRFGDARSNLTVNYSLGGTASNGVDYVALPGSVNVAAGSGYALIPIVPIDNRTNGFPKTVILTLRTNANYRVGVPWRAEALILTNWLRPLPLVLADRSFHVNAAGPDGAWFCVQYSTDFANWTPICTNQVIQGAIDFVDPEAQGNPSRFYRAIPVTATPQ